MSKSKHKHNYAEDVLVRHWYRGYIGVTFYCGVAKRCTTCGKTKHEGFCWTLPLNDGQLLHRVCHGEDVVERFPDYPIIDQIPPHLAYEVNQYESQRTE